MRGVFLLDNIGFLHWHWSEAHAVLRVSISALVRAKAQLCHGYPPWRCNFFSATSGLFGSCRVLSAYKSYPFVPAATKIGSVEHTPEEEVPGRQIQRTEKRCVDRMLSWKSPNALYIICNEKSLEICTAFKQIMACGMYSTWMTFGWMTRKACMVQRDLSPQSWRFRVWTKAAAAKCASQPLPWTGSLHDQRPPLQINFCCKVPVLCNVPSRDQELEKMSLVKGVNSDSFHETLLLEHLEV